MLYIEAIEKRSAKPLELSILSETETMAQTMKIDVAQAMKMGEKLPAPASGMEQVVCKPSDNHLVQMLKIIFISAHLNIYYMSCTFITK